jgi:hypothetical protein
MIFAKHESATFLAHPFAIAFEDGAADVLAFEGEASSLGGKMGADGQPH